MKVRNSLRSLKNRAIVTLRVCCVGQSRRYVNQQNAAPFQSPSGLSFARMGLKARCLRGGFFFVWADGNIATPCAGHPRGHSRLAPLRSPQTPRLSLLQKDELKGIST